MNKFINNFRPWIPTIVLIVMAAFALVRMQTVQAAMMIQIDSKLSAEVYQADKKSLDRELDLIHESLNRIEAKLDNAIRKP